MKYESRIKRDICTNRIKMDMYKKNEMKAIKITIIIIKGI